MGFDLEIHSISFSRFNKVEIVVKLKDIFLDFKEEIMKLQYKLTDLHFV